MNHSTTFHFSALQKLSIWLFIVVASGVSFLPTDIAEFCSQPMSGVRDTCIMISYFGLIFICQTAFIGILATNRYVFALLFPLTIVVNYLLLYFKSALGVTVSATLVELLINNDIVTSSDFITLPVVAIFLSALIIGGVFTIIRFKCITTSLQRKLIAFCISIGILCGTFTLHRTRQMLLNRTPFNIYAAVRDYSAMKKEYSERRTTFDNIKIFADADSLTVVLVIGESLRSDHLGLNSYHRNTTPLLAREKNLISFPSITTLCYHTAISIPVMLTRAETPTDTIGYTEQSFIPIFSLAGFRTAWIANQEPVNSFVYFTHEADTVYRTYSNHSVYNYDKWLDEDMLAPLKEELSNEAKKKLLILHTIGSHWWFNSHYSEQFEHFTPVLKSRNVSSNSQEEFINSYDNTVLYTDWFLASVIDMLRNRSAIMIFMSDHGEGLGENGGYLHADKNPGTEKVATLIWYSDRYASKYPSKIANLHRHRMTAETSRILFHTILDCASIKSPVIRKSLSAGSESYSDKVESDSAGE